MLLDRINSDLHASVLASDVLRRDTLRMLVSELNYKKIEVQKDLSDADVVSVLQKEVKKRNEAILSWEASGRTESADKERQELAILQTYLPAQMSEEEIKQEIERLNLPKDFASAMKIVAPHFKGRADGKLVAKIVNEKNS
jgi:uncharacterized protein YqeY